MTASHDIEKISGMSTAATATLFDNALIAGRMVVDLGKFEAIVGACMEADGGKAETRRAA